MNNFANINTNIKSILMLNDINFKSQQENLLIVLEVMYLDLIIRIDSLPPLTNKNTYDERKEKER